MIEKGWILRAPIVWRRQKYIPEPNAKDRPGEASEMVFMFSKSRRYFFSRKKLAFASAARRISGR